METVKEKLAKLLTESRLKPVRLEGRKLIRPASSVEIADHLIQNGVTIQEWVSVDERLPEKQHDWVLTACKLVPEGYYGVPHIAELRNGKWWADGGDFPLIEIGVEVTHWMPLPAPPKGVQ